MDPPFLKMEISMITLSHDFITVKSQTSNLYGGAQQHCKQKHMQGYGCGTIGCANVIFYDAHKVSGNLTIDEEEYLSKVDYLRKRFLFVIPKFGMNGIFMALGLNAYYLTHGVNKRAWWGCLHKNVYKHIERMLKDDEPVVLSIGPNFPNLIFGKKGVKLYTKNNEKFIYAVSTHAHYVTVTGIDDEWMQVSSWGTKYYVNRKEYTEYVKRSSTALFSSILIIRPRR